MGNLTAKTSGEIASFMTPAETNIKSLKVHFSPKQLGEGDPSPENVREIVGWDGVEVYSAGRNLLQNADGKISPLKLKKGTVITASSDEGGYFRGKKNGEWVTPIVWLNKTAKNGRKYTEPYTLPEDIDEGSIFLAIGVSKAQITLDGTIDYKPYQGNTISYQWKLPDEYQEVEYIESTGTQAILTDIPCQLPLKTDIDIMFTSNNDSYFCGTRYGNIRICSGGNYQTNVQWAFGTYRLTNGINLNTRYLLSTYLDNGNQLIIKDNIVLNTYQYTISDNDIKNIEGNLALFAMWLNDSQTFGQFAKAKCYGIRISNNNKMLGNFVPCYRKSDNEIGMYDTVSQTFYTNQRTGTFLKGEDVDKTFYGGYVDLISGELVETNVRDLLDAVNKEALSTEYNTSQTVFFRCDTDYTFETKKGTVTGISDFYCESLKPVSRNWDSGDSQDSLVNTITQRYRSTNAVCMRMYNSVFDINADDTVEVKKQKINTWLANNPIVISYKLAEPITHQLTPTQLSSFIGQNNFWSNADYVEIEYELKETEDIQKVRKKIILNQPHIESINGDIASFTTNMKAPLKECKVYFNPIQEGSGDPSPDNVRNIIGWDGVNVGLPDEYQEVEYIESTGTQYIKTDIKSRPIIEYESVLEFTNGSDQYTVGFRDGNFRAVGNGYYASKTQIAYNTTYKLGAHLSLNKKYKYKTCLKPNEQNVFLDDEMVASYDLPQTETVLSDKHVGIFCQLSNDTTPQFLSKIKLTSLAIKENDLLLGNFIPCYRKSDGEIGMYDTVSKTFYTNSGTGTFLKGDDVNTIIGNVNWSDEVGTVYGGYVDLAKGEVVAEYFGFIADGENIKTNSGYVNDTSYGAGIVYMDRYGFPDSDRLRVNTYCNTLNPIRSTSQNCVYWATNGGFYLVFYPFSKTTEESKASSEALEETNEWLKQHPTQIVYKLRTPIRYQLTPQQLLTFKGENNIWSDTNGQTEVKFWTH